jgi:hypothetical protein
LSRPVPDVACAIDWAVPPLALSAIAAAIAVTPLMLLVLAPKRRASQLLRELQPMRPQRRSSVEAAPTLGALEGVLAAHAADEISLADTQSDTPTTLLGVSLPLVVAALEAGAPASAVLNELYHGSRFLRRCDSRACSLSIISYRSTAHPAPTHHSPLHSYAL